MFKTKTGSKKEKPQWKNKMKGLKAQKIWKRTKDFLGAKCKDIKTKHSMMRKFNKYGNIAQQRIQPPSPELCLCWAQVDARRTDAGPTPASGRSAWGWGNHMYIFPYQTAAIMPPLRDLCAGRFAGIISVQNRKCSKWGKVSCRPQNLLVSCPLTMPLSHPVSIKVTMTKEWFTLFPLFSNLPKPFNLEKISKN